MEETQLGYDVLQLDQTTVQVLKEDGRAAQTKSRMWVSRGGPPDKPVVLFNYEPTRSGAIAWRLTEDFTDYLQSDGYSGYVAIGNAMAWCMSAASRMRGASRRSVEGAEGERSRWPRGTGPREDPENLPRGKVSARPT